MKRGWTQYLVLGVAFVLLLMYLETHVVTRPQVTSFAVIEEAVQTEESAQPITSQENYIDEEKYRKGMTHSLNAGRRLLQKSKASVIVGEGDIVEFITYDDQQITLLIDSVSDKEVRLRIQDVPGLIDIEKGKYRVFDMDQDDLQDYLIMLEDIQIEETVIKADLLIVSIPEGETVISDLEQDSDQAKEVVDGLIELSPRLLSESKRNTPLINNQIILVASIGAIVMLLGYSLMSRIRKLKGIDTEQAKQRFTDQMSRLQTYD